MKSIGRPSAAQTILRVAAQHERPGRSFGQRTTRQIAAAYRLQSFVLDVLLGYRPQRLGNRDARVVGAYLRLCYAAKARLEAGE